VKQETRHAEDHDRLLNVRSADFDDQPSLAAGEIGDERRTGTCRTSF
jgi:hypothetical protein